MKAFILSILAAAGLAVAAGIVLESTFRRNADQVFASPDARVGESGAIEARRFDGRR